MPDAPPGSREYIRWAIEGSLRRLRTDVIDLYQYHEPDGTTPIEETLGALDELVREGRVRFVGCSNFSAAQLEEAVRVADGAGYAHFVSLQNEYSLLVRGIEAEVAEACLRHGVSIIPYFPLASRPADGQVPPRRAGARRHAAGRSRTGGRRCALRRRRGTGALRLRARPDRCSTWRSRGLAAQPGVVSVIAGATRPEQVRANAAAALAWSPSPEELRALDQIAPTPRVR